jgi:hypothetical protein
MRRYRDLESPAARHETRRIGRDNPVAGLSELEVALLALPSIRPMTGYEILRHH